MNSCRFFEEEESAAYALTTANSIVIINLDDAKVLKEHNTIIDYETNEFSLIEAYTKAKDPCVYYLSANLQ
jgi:hypothetical protein